MNQNKELFERAPVQKAIISLVVPTIISQLITVIYNMADTFFIGQIGDPNQVAAVSLSMPLFILLTGMANLFGIGGASLISRSLGVGDRDKARRVAVFSIWSAGGFSLIYGVSLFLLKDVVFPLVGTNADTFEYCSQYVLWVVTVGAVPTVLNTVLAHLVRAEGYSKQASFGMTMGGVLNMILDPIFISGLNMEIEGAAVATMLSNLIATLYFVGLIAKKRGDTVLTLHPRYYTLGERIPFEVLLVGLPSCLMNLMGVFSNVVMNRLMVSYCNEAVAGIGIAKKVDLLAFAIATGMSQGVLPLIGYNYAAKNFKRMMQAVRTTFVYSMVIAVAGTILLLTCASPIVKAFIDDELTVQYGQHFQKVICITGPCISVTMIVITIFQSVGQKIQPLMLSFLRKGGLDVPMMLLMNHLMGVNGIAWATPMADFGAMLVSIVLFIPFWKKLKENDMLCEGHLY